LINITMQILIDIETETSLLGIRIKLLH